MSSNTVRSGDSAVGRPLRQPAHLGGVQRATRALVGERGVDVAIGDDNSAALERRPDRSPRRVARGRRRRASLRCAASCRCCALSSSSARICATELGCTRLEGQDDVVAARPSSASASRRACVDLPAPSPPSNAMNKPPCPRPSCGTRRADRSAEVCAQRHVADGRPSCRRQTTPTTMATMPAANKVTVTPSRRSVAPPIAPSADRSRRRRTAPRRAPPAASTASCCR